MKTIAYICSVILLLFVSSCQDDTLIINNRSKEASGTVALNFAEPPTGVSQVIAKLTRQGFSDITLALTISGSGSQASGSMTNVVSGVWHLKVDALNDSGAVLYTGETDVNVITGQTANVSLALEPAGGGILITVTWGQTVLFSDDFSKGNSNGWIYKTGSWNFIDSLVQTDEVFGHHFLMLPAHDIQNFEFQADVMKTSDDNDPEHPAIVFRWISDTMNYVFRINGVGSQSWIQLMRDMDNRDQNSQYIDSHPWLASDSDHRMDRDVWYTMKVRANNSHIQCKVWKTSDPEPSDWIIDLQDMTYSHGLIGLEYYTGRHRFDNVIVRSLN